MSLQVSRKQLPYRRQDFIRRVSDTVGYRVVDVAVRGIAVVGVLAGVF